MTMFSFPFRPLMKVLGLRPKLHVDIFSSLSAYVPVPGLYSPCNFLLGLDIATEEIWQRQEESLAPGGFCLWQMCLDLKTQNH